MKEQRFCEVCGARLKKGQGIEIGISVMHGTMKVCSQKCLDRLNAGNWPSNLDEADK